MIAPTDAASGGNITISIVKPKPPGSGFAKRCAIGGSPLATSCTGGSAGLAFDKAGLLYLTNDHALHRFEVTAGEPCKLAPAGEPIAMPEDRPRMQTVGEGSIYMRSGGAAWNLVATGGAVYAHDFLIGIYRVDRGKPEPVCTELFGFGSIAKLGKRWLARRKGIEEIVVGKDGACKARSAGIDDRPRGEIHVVRDRLYAGSADLVRYDGKTAVALGTAVRICSLHAMTACGDGVCAVDHNCPGIVQLAAGGAVLRMLDSGKLFDVPPWSLGAATTAPDGTVYLHTRHRDKGPDGKAHCEVAVYALPAALFAR